jgi:sulfur carrier protein ThiS
MITIKILLRGTLPKYWAGEKERTIEIPEGTTCHEALKSQGIDYEKIPRFGFVAVNGMRVMIHQELKDGDELKAYSKVSGG